ncbi:MAG TPA: hypothetical protein VEG63_09795 [Candidatus Acidoferrales bacterium]|nr:hypothetical protein [Candidatus Acidoferrales bacterium]
MSANPITQAAGSLLATAERRLAAVAVLLALGAGAIGFRSWLEERDARVQMFATIASQNSIISAAEKREQDRAQQLTDTLKQISDLKATVQTPQQVIREIPQYLPPLPQPLSTIAPGNSGSVGASAAQAAAMPGPAAAQGQLSAPAKAGEVTTPDVRVPSADLKPLFDFVQDCRASQAQLAAAQQDAQDQRTKNDAITKERDAAVKTAKGGSLWTRSVRAAKWVAVGFVVGFVARSAVR